MDEDVRSYHERELWAMGYSKEDIEKIINVSLECNLSPSQLGRAIHMISKEKILKPTRIDKRIYQTNEVASKDDVQFTKLTIFARAHPIVMADIMREFKRSSDWRFGDTLLIFCDSVKYGRIKIKNEEDKI